MPKNSPSGKVFLVGAGPGDPGLLTLRAAEVLRAADVLLYDALASDAVVAFAPPSCERIFVGKRGGDHAMAQRDIESLMIGKAREHHRVVRLKGGDPFVFGRGGEEAQALRAAGVPFEIVPGISSALAVPAYAGIPVTHRDYAASFTVLTGREDLTKAASSLDWAKLADARRTLVILMGIGNLHEVAQQLIAHGLSPATPAAVVQDGTRPSQRTVTGTLATIADDAAGAEVQAPAIAIVGGVAALRDELRWFDSTPFFGKRVLITRTGQQSKTLAWELMTRGAEPIVAPTIAIEPPDDPTGHDIALEALGSYAWIVFTSQNGVDRFFDRLAERHADARAIGSLRVAAIGERTAQRLLDRGVRADAVPEEFVAEEVARAVIERSSAGDRILIYRAQEARDVLPRMLHDAGRTVSVVAAYKTVVPNDPHFAAKVARADVLTFTSASTVRGFAKLLGGDAAAAEAVRGKCVACIGPITARTARDAGLHVDVTAERYTTLGLLAALEAYFDGES
ncbi:MAG TPA: uroporphyrinogen-III C-methyltransferase [Candidatus Cybelea sp.]|nr:uroporphyrinogen-III C-methyltransferase [Candidatus Cybelea sp.]